MLRVHTRFKNMVLCLWLEIVIPWTLACKYTQWHIMYIRSNGFWLQTFQQIFFNINQIWLNVLIWLCFWISDHYSLLHMPWKLPFVVAWAAWISNHIIYKVWDENTHPFPNFNEVWEWMSNFIPHSAMELHHSCTKPSTSAYIHIYLVLCAGRPQLAITLIYRHRQEMKAAMIGPTIHHLTRVT